MERDEGYVPAIHLKPEIISPKRISGGRKNQRRKKAEVLFQEPFPSNQIKPLVYGLIATHLLFFGCLLLLFLKY
jgi:hypothetical protein